MLQSSIYEEIDPSKKKGHTIFHGLKSSITAIAVHPKKPILAIGGAEGFVLLWDYQKKGDPLFHNYEFIPKDDPKQKERKEGQQEFTCMAFTPDGEELLIGMQNSSIQVMDTTTATYKKFTTNLFASENKGSGITGIVVSNDGQYFATMD